ncbi:hypothetical protein AVEN_213749-1 [Araneus ventricosus]|uniref:Adult-specific rigid cuticular protein 15.7 n=1 Tax=Araneus ventricosus TaxID=182803 RepID=A0A4Y2EII6_ARAVE|nr:hypothetical protein AVEN_213749-1 [Araneus ventricosus]
MERREPYTIADIDGRARRVDYAGDALGFRRATVKTNEPELPPAPQPPPSSLFSPTPDPSPQSSNHVAPLLPPLSDTLPPLHWLLPFWLAAPVAYGGVIDTEPPSLPPCSLRWSHRTRSRLRIELLWTGYGLGYGKSSIH